MNHVIHQIFHILCTCQLCLQRLRSHDLDLSDHLCIISFIWLDYATLIPGTTNSVNTKNVPHLQVSLIRIQLLCWEKFICTTIFYRKNSYVSTTFIITDSTNSNRKFIFFNHHTVPFDFNGKKQIWNSLNLWIPPTIFIFRPSPAKGDGKVTVGWR